MQVTITFDPANQVEVQDAIKTVQAFAFAQQSGNAPAASEKAAKPPKETKAAASPPPPPPAPPPAPEPDPLEDAVTIDREMVRASLKKVQTLDGKDAAVAILKKYGANSMSELKEENFAGAYADAEANPKVKAG
jgi:hypothetical protein